MKPRIHVITLAVSDLDRALTFYRDGLGLQSPGVIGTEFAGDEQNPAGAVAMFDLHGGLILSLYLRTELAKDTKIPFHTPASGEFSLGHLVAGRQEVDSMLAAAQAAGATLTGEPHDRPWGIYSGYFRDPDGHLWGSHLEPIAHRHIKSTVNRPTEIVVKFSPATQNWTIGALIAATITLPRRDA